MVSFSQLFERWTLYAKRAAWVSVFTLFFGFLDIMSTYYGITSGITVEVNPIPAALIKRFGVDTAVLLIFPWLKVIFIILPLLAIYFWEKKWPKDIWAHRCLLGLVYFNLLINIAIVCFNLINLY